MQRLSEFCLIDDTTREYADWLMFDTARDPRDPRDSQGAVGLYDVDVCNWDSIDQRLATTDNHDIANVTVIGFNEQRFADLIVARPGSAAAKEMQRVEMRVECCIPIDEDMYLERLLEYVTTHWGRMTQCERAKELAYYGVRVPPRQMSGEGLPESLDYYVHHDGVIGWQYRARAKGTGQ